MYMRDKPARSRGFNFSKTQDKEKTTRCQRLLIKDLEIVALTIDFDDGVFL